MNYTPSSFKIVSIFWSFLGVTESVLVTINTTLMFLALRIFYISLSLDRVGSLASNVIRQTLIFYRSLSKFVQYFFERLSLVLGKYAVLIDFITNPNFYAGNYKTGSSGFWGNLLWYWLSSSCLKGYILGNA